MNERIVAAIICHGKPVIGGTRMPGGSGNGKPQGRNELRRSSARILSGHTPLRSRARHSMHVYTRKRQLANLRKHGRRGFIGNAPIVGRSPQVTMVGDPVLRHVRYILRTPPNSTVNAAKLCVFSSWWRGSPRLGAQCFRRYP
jgi:hypothetical protein